MNDQSWEEFQTLKRRHANLERDLSDLGLRLAALEARLGTQRTLSSSVASPAESLRQQAPGFVELPPPGLEPLLPPIISQTQFGRAEVQSREVGAADLSGHAQVAQASGTPNPPSPPVVAVPPKHGNGDGAASFEMRLGTYWLVRIGIVMVLTVLVFFGNLAYQNFISRMGPGGKVTLLYLASFSLMGAGFWFQRRQGRETVRNYGQVLTAGGLAAVYFTTYAAHHFANLRIISSPLLDGALLLAWAGFIFWLADRRRSEVLALFAVGLAYYTSVITRVGHFTLYSNLILAATAGFFLLRHSWVKLTIASLPATYGSYAYWRFFDGRGWSWPTPEQGLWAGAFFLFCYWGLFTVAGFRSRHQELTGRNRAFFLSANNAALFCLFLLTMLQVREGGLWRFLAVYGATLIGVSIAARRLLPEEPVVRDAYLSQGLVLVTGALVARFSSMQLALMLGLESTILLMQSRLGARWLLRIGSWITASMAIAWGLEGLQRFETTSLWLAIGLGALMIFNAITSRRDTPLKFTNWFDSEPGGFSLLALAIWFGAVWHNSTGPYLSLVLAGLAVILSLSVYGLRLPELSLLAQGYAVLGLLVWLGRLTTLTHSPPIWQHLLIMSSILFLTHWWPRQDRVPVGRGVIAFEALYSLGVIALLFGYFAPRIPDGGWPWVGALLCVACTVYGALTRAWILALGGQAFIAIAGAAFLAALQQTKPEWYEAVVLVLALVGLAKAANWWLDERTSISETIRKPVLELARAYRWAAVLLGVAWVCCCSGPNLRVVLLAMAGATFAVAAGWRRDRELLCFAGICWIPFLFYFFIPELGTPRLSWAHPLALLLFLGQQRVARRWSDDFAPDPRLHHIVIVIGGVCFWTLVSRYVLAHAAGFYLTASWSGVAVVLFTLGMVFRERAYRYLGLGILACALARVVIFDVWKLETLFRMLSFLALGIALLVLGFVYNRFQEKIKQWL